MASGAFFIPKFRKEKNMKFEEALKNMKADIPMKLPSWGGYWFWDPEKETIMMKCRKVDSETGKDLLDIRETQRVEYTLANILSDEWVPATGENTTILGGTSTFSFGDAIKYLKRGMKVKRQGWNGKNQYIRLAKNISYITEIFKIATMTQSGIWLLLLLEHLECSLVGVLLRQIC